VFDANMESEGRLLKLVACSCSWFCPESGRSKQKVAELTIFSKVMLLHDLLSKRELADGKQKGEEAKFHLEIHMVPSSSKTGISYAEAFSTSNPRLVLKDINQ
jgi:hypothetical protein